MVAGDCLPWLSRKFVVSAWRTHSSFTTPDPQTSGMKMKSSVRGSSGARFQFQNITLHGGWLSSELCFCIKHCFILHHEEEEEEEQQYIAAAVVVKHHERLKQSIVM